MGDTQKRLPVHLITVARAFAVGLAYYIVKDIPGLTTAFVAIFVAVLPFDLMVAMPKITLQLKYWEELFLVILPRISGTALTLIKGLLVAVIFGGLAHVGLPLFWSSVFMIGFAYNAGINTKGNVSTVLGVIAGLSLYDEIIRLPSITSTLLTDIAGLGLRIMYATFAAFFTGWVVGVGVGVVTRLFLPRGYRSRKSSAYELPLTLQPFKNVIHLDEEDMVILRSRVGKNSKLVNKSLKDANLRCTYRASVLSIFRKPKDVAVPQGNDIIFPDDILVIVMPTDKTGEVLDLVKGSESDE